MGNIGTRDHIVLYQAMLCISIEHNDEQTFCQPSSFPHIVTQITRCKHCVTELKRRLGTSDFTCPFAAVKIGRNFPVTIEAHRNSWKEPQLPVVYLILMVSFPQLPPPYPGRIHYQSRP